MLSKFSVKKPYTVFVAVVLVLVLGAISFFNLTTDLLPSLELPYMIVMTTYPGASPEKVESAVTKPLEASLSTTSGIKNVQSVSRENVSIVTLEFEQSTNMDSAMLDVSGKIDLVEGNFDDMVGTPTMMRISPDMLPVMVASVDMDGMDIYEISSYVQDEILPYFERLHGVASVDTTGIVESQVTVKMNQSKIDEINDKVLASVDVELAKAQKELRDARAKLNDGKAQLLDGENKLESNKSGMVSELANGSAQIDAGMAQLAALLSEESVLTANEQAFLAEKAGYEKALPSLTAFETAVGAIEQADVQMGAVSPTGKGPISTALEPFTVATPKTLTELSLISEQAYEAYQQAVVALAQMIGQPELGAIANVTQVDLKQLLHIPTRLAEIETELTNINTRKMVINAMKPELEANLSKLKEAYAALESGKMQAVNELTKGEITIANSKEQLDQAQAQLDEAQSQLDDARDEAYKKADISGVLTQDMISKILLAENFNMPAGYITQNEEQLLVKVGEAYTSIEELENTLLFHADIEGIGDVRLSDIAEISVTDNSADSYARVNNNPSVILTFQKQSTASTADVSDKVASTIKQLESEFEGLHITPLMDQGDYIDLVVNSVLSNLIFGGLLAILILVLFLKDLSPTLIVACSIPFSLLCAITAMYFSNITLNIISLSGLALGVGMLVDNSIVVIENIYRLRNEGMSAAQAAVTGAKQVSGAIFASTLTTICVFLPIVFTDGISKQLFTDMGLTIAYALLASLFVALTLVPAMGASLMKNSKEKEHKWFDKFADAYAKVLRFSLRNKAIVIVGALALLVFSVFQMTKMGTALIPSMYSPQMSATMQMPKGSSQTDAYEMSDVVAERIALIDGVETVGAMSSGSGMSGMMGGSSSGTTMQFYILLADNYNATNAEISQQIINATSDLDCTIEVEESMMDVSALGGGSGIQVNIYGTELEKMQSIADDVKGIMRSTNGTQEIETETEISQEMRIIVNKDEAMRYNLTVAQVYSEIAAKLQNENTATTLTVNGVDYPVIMVKDDANMVTQSNILNHEFKVTNANGEEEKVYLHQIAQSTIASSVQNINRANGTRTMSVSTGIAEGYNIGIVSRDFEKALASYEVPAGYEIEISGENETINSAMYDLVLMLLLAIVFIYLIMVAQFQSLMSPFIVMFTIPLAFTGGLLALWITGLELSIISVLGFLVLSGVVVNNGIVFVDTINQLRLEGVSRREAIIRTGRLRVRPVLMTALTTILAMSTMAVGLGKGSEMTQPMAIVTIGGLAYATLLTLVVVPVLYDIMRKKDLCKVEVE